jgi:hypothetical protein
MSRGYPNMSYCQCENTLLALQQVLNSMEDQGPEFLEDMNSTERRAYQELYNACEAFIRQADIMQDPVGEQQA